MNAMLGLKELGEARFKDLWRVFEQFIPKHYQAIKFQSAVASDDADIQL
jgi:hypothetical protein